MDTKQITYSVTFVFRRGLQADLLAANEVPYDGEPIIETDTLKIKIGDGITPYSELNYVCANELEILQEQLDAFFANADVSDKAIDTLLEIQKILNDSSVDIQGLLNKVNEFEALHKEIVNTHNTDKAALEAQIDELVNACDEAFNEAADDRAAIRSEIANASSAAQEDRALIRSQYAEADNILSTTCAAENAAIRAEFAAADLTLTNSLNEEIARATAAEADALAQSKAYTDSVKTAILGSEQLESTFNTLTNIAAWIEGDGVNATELTEAIAVETQNRATEDAAIRQSITDLNTTINTAINDLDIAHKAEIKSTNDTVAALGTELRGVDSNINTRLDAAITAHEAEDARIDAAYKAADAALEEALKNYFDTELGVIANGQY